MWNNLLVTVAVLALIITVLGRTAPENEFQNAQIKNTNIIQVSR